MSDGSKKNCLEPNIKKLEVERDKLSGSLNKFLQLSSSLANPLLSREEQVVAEPMIIIEDQQPSTSGSSETPVSPELRCARKGFQI
ncbi:unnamed protein product [Larinioides sclopetarius]|uniref:Uncharacterized protein n=1 Tax=Larinioides sclopetarius TaxID=280406 RepID=A0AAV2BBH8_9ARAC